MIPLSNEETVIGNVVCDAPLPNDDDCSVDGGADVARAAGVRHPVNLGQGPALQTGSEFARSIPSMRWVVIFDADFQHQVPDVLAVFGKARSEELEVVFGSRFLDGRTKPSLMRMIVLQLAVGYTNLTTGTKPTYAHSGLRVMRRDVVERLDITQSRLAHASELVAQISELRVRYAESSVHILPTDYSKSKGEPCGTVNVLVELMFR